MSDVRRAIALYDSKQYAIALPLFQAVLRRCEQKPDGASSAETASLVFKIGYCYDKLSDFLIAAGHFRRAAATSNSCFENRIRASNNAVQAFYDIGDYAETETQTNISISMIDVEATVERTLLPC